jgi:molybdopterin converting factor small subunit
MSVTVRIPGVLRRLTAGHDEVEVTGATVEEALEAVGREHTGFLDRVRTGPGQARPFLNLFVNGQDIRFIGGMGTPVYEGDEISIIPSVAGGR